MSNIVQVEPAESYDAFESQRGHHFEPDASWRYFVDDCDLIDEDGKVLAIHRKNALSDEACAAAYEGLLPLAKLKRNNRCDAAGVIDESLFAESYRGRLVNDGKSTNSKYMRKDGQEGAYWTSNPARSNVVGYYENGFGSSRKIAGEPPIRQTAFMKREPERFEMAVPLFREMDRAYAAMIPGVYAKQAEAASALGACIEGTSFSTATINLNFRTAAHRDIGSFHGYNAMAVIHSGLPLAKPAWFLLPRYRVAINVEHRGIVAANVHEWHCNAPLEEHKDASRRTPSHRMSIVSYLRMPIFRACADEAVRERFAGGQYSNAHVQNHSRFHYEWREEKRAGEAAAERRE